VWFSILKFSALRLGTFAGGAFAFARGLVGWGHLGLSEKGLRGGFGVSDSEKKCPENRFERR